MSVTMSRRRERVESAVTKANLDWANLDFGYHKTDFNIRYTWRDGAWDQGVLTHEETLPLHMASTCLHYGQEAFEGLKAFETRRGDVVVFRPDENAKRMVRSSNKIMMQPPPEALFIEAVERVINANRKFVPPYGSGASLYIRPLVLGISALVGVKPSSEYLFMIFVTPVGPYFKTGFKPVDMLIEEHVDRAAPLGVGDIKCGGNYAAGIRASVAAKKQGYADVIYLDAKEHKYMDESAPANFFAITKEGQYVTPASPSVLPSITNMSLITLAEEMGLRPQRRHVPVEEIFEFTEAGACGTAAVITPIGSLTYQSRKMVYCPDGRAGKNSTELYQRLRGIQNGDLPDKYGWLHPVPAPKK